MVILQMPICKVLADGHRIAQMDLLQAVLLHLLSIFGKMCLDTALMHSA